MSALIRLAAREDAEAIQEIYAPFVQGSPVSFEVEPPTVAEMRQRIRDILEHYPWLVCEQDGVIAGYVYACPHRTRRAYQWSVDVAVYIHERYRGCGVGRALYTSLFRLLVMQGFYNAYAGITLPNPGSVGLHEAMGFQPIGVYRSVGYKAGAWQNVGWWELAMQSPSISEPAAPLPLDAIVGGPDWDAALNAGAKYLRL